MRRRGLLRKRLVTSLLSSLDKSIDCPSSVWSRWLPEQTDVAAVAMTSYFAGRLGRITGGSGAFARYLTAMMLMVCYHTAAGKRSLSIRIMGTETHFLDQGN